MLWQARDRNENSNVDLVTSCHPAPVRGQSQHQAVVANQNDLWPAVVADVSCVIEATCLIFSSSSTPAISYGEPRVIGMGESTVWHHAVTRSGAEKCKAQISTAAMFVNGDEIPLTEDEAFRRMPIRNSYNVRVKPSSSAALAIASGIAAILGEVVFSRPFNSVFEKILDDRSKSFDAFCIKEFLQSDKPTVGLATPNVDTLGKQRRYVLARMSALAATLTSLAIAFLSGTAAVVVELVLGRGLKSGWVILGWVVVAAEIVAAGLLYWQVRQGKFREKPWTPTSGRWLTKQFTKLVKLSTPRPYSALLVVVSVLSLLVGVFAVPSDSTSSQSLQTCHYRPHNSGRIGGRIGPRTPNGCRRSDDPSTRVVKF